MKNNLRVITALLCCIVTNAHAQFPDKLKNGLRYYTDSKDSSRYIGFGMTAQLWARNTSNNPYSLVQGTPQNNTTDFSIRRIRFVLSGAISDRVNFFVQFGQNSLNYLSARKAGSFFHDATADYAIVKKHLSVGVGLNGFNGPSRFANASVASIAVLDVPAYQEVTNDTYDQNVRRLGMYMKGKLGKLDYRLSVGKPFVIQTASGSGIEPINANAVFSTRPPAMNTQGYFMYQFLDQESNFSSGTTGTYLGRKKVFNIGAGFNHQKNAMMRYADVALKDTVGEAINLFAVDVFYDAPVSEEKGTAYNFYASFSRYNYGTGFIRVAGADNPANGSYNTGSTFSKLNFGNAFPVIGSGNVAYLQTAYKLKDRLFGNQGTLQPFADLQYAKYDRLSDRMYVFDIGLHWLLYGNNTKLTLNYQNRPYFEQDANGALVQRSRRGELVLQYQLSF
ncbi:MAG: hypothetical protein JWR61_1673 [Ferruginibacter sp.]|uniref:porin n=1 Tax=Ferruginibacter sp. TaxID=1940288 RepID=UPI002658B817|nr:porin [Ferruginibacter sp.]MDB5276718.1 hypothetical protein [Ferruginibacter sp.]